MDKGAINFSFLIFVLKVDGSLFITEKSLPWPLNDNICTVAVPSLSFSSGGVYADIGELEVNDTVLSEYGVWVGYNEMSKAFDYIDCLQLNPKIFEEISAQKVNQASPGRCHSACGYGSTFGIFENQCFCLKTYIGSKNLHTTDSICNVECDDQVGLACGGSPLNDSLKISVYRYNPYVETKNGFEEEGAFCLKVKPKIREYHWSNCSEQLHEMCYFSGTYIPTSSKVNSNSWVKNSNICIRNGGMAVPIENSIDIKLKKYDELWTNTIRTPVILSIRANENDATNFRNQIGMGYGFIQKYNDRIHLSFSRSPDERRYILCTQDDDTDSIEWIIQVAIVTTALLAILITVIIIKRRQKVIMMRRYSLHNERNKETVSTAVVINIEESRDADQKIIVQGLDSAADNPNILEKTDYDTTDLFKNESREETGDAHNIPKRENKSYHKTLTRNKKVTYLSDRTYENTVIVHSMFNDSENLTDEHASCAEANEVTKINDFVEPIKTDHMYDEIEYQTETLNDTFENDIDDENDATEYELSHLTHIYGNVEKKLGMQFN